MFFKIDHGLFNFDFTDHHAVLGVSVDSNFKEIRKRYLQIARLLHPDSCNASSEADKQRASQLLSKLVNPAYEQFSQERSRAEYTVLLREMSKRLGQESAAVEIKYELSKQLNESNNIEHTYKTALYKLAEKQYESFEQAPQLIAQISELNLVYLRRKGGSALPLPSSPPAAVTGTSPNKNTPPPTPQPESVVEQYLRRAQGLIEKNSFTLARVELQDALKLEPNNSRCHSLMGVVYFRQNQLTMAKVHINKALQLNPKDQMALQGKQLLDQISQKTGGQPPAGSKSNEGKQSDQSGRSGLFGGLFGGKKK